MTKVGVYAILRVNGTVFDDALSREILQQWLLPIGLITSLYGAYAAMGTDRLRRFVGFMILSSVGTILVAISLFNGDAWAAGLYYLIHSTVIAAAFYLLSGWITSQRGEFKDHFKIAPRMKQHNAIAVCYFLIALMMAGLPPFSGFLGKVFILQATADSPYQIIIILVILLVSLLSIIAFTRVGFILFWRATQPENDVNTEEYQRYQALPVQAPRRNDKAIYVLLAGLIAYMAFAAPIYDYTQKTAHQIQNNALYEQLLLKKDAEGQVISVQPYDPENLPETKYGGESADPNAHLIPALIAPETLQGEHISQYKQQQMNKQAVDETQSDTTQLKPMEAP